MVEKKWTTIKVDSNFAKEMKEAAKMRYFKNLAKKEPSSPEMTRLLMRTPEYKNALSKLKSLPKKEDLI
jgi:hypothetical protein